jgi:hypothetical protein
LGSNYKILNVNGNTYVPIRFVVENIGGVIKYDEKSKSINIQHGNQSTIVDPNDPEAYLSDLHIVKNQLSTEIDANLHLPSVAGDQRIRFWVKSILV